MSDEPVCEQCLADIVDGVMFCPACWNAAIESRDARIRELEIEVGRYRDALREELIEQWDNAPAWSRERRYATAQEWADSVLAEINRENSRDE